MTKTCGRDTLTSRVPTSDDWCPTHPDGTVELKFRQLQPTKQWRVSVWGEDDLGMDRDFPENRREEAVQLYKDIKHISDVTKASLLKLGLDYF